MLSGSCKLFVAPTKGQHHFGRFRDRGWICFAAAMNANNIDIEANCDVAVRSLAALILGQELCTLVLSVNKLQIIHSRNIQKQLL